MEIFSKRLRELREGRRYSQAEMAKNIEVSQSYYSKFELDQGEPNMQLLVKIADFFEVTTDYLLGRTEIKNAFLEENRIIKQEKIDIANFREQLTFLSEQLKIIEEKDKEYDLKQKELNRKVDEILKQSENK